jgi:sugar transferase (PEP-CTERM/EpsH1 system associated)
MKILFLVSRVPFELDKGDKLRAFHQLKYLSRHHEVILFALSDEPVPAGAQAALAAICEEVIICPVSRTEALWNMTKGIPRSWPLQVAYFYNKKAQQQLDELVNRHQPNHIFCQLVRMAPYVRQYPHIPMTLDYMDAFSKGLERRMQTASIFRKPFFYLEYKRLLRYEARLFPLFQHKVIISEQDRFYIRHPQKYAITVVPNGVDAIHFSPVPTEKVFHLLFAGNLSYPPNIEACRYLVRKVLPLVLPHYPQLRVLLAGKTPAAAVTALAGDQVEIRVNLADMREAYSAARIFVAPLFLGSGLQNKILEAMAMGIPCITTGQVNKALGAKKGEQLLLAESAQGFAAHILYLLHHPQEASRMAAQAQVLVEKQYNWDHINARLENLLSAAQ